MIISSLNDSLLENYKKCHPRLPEAIDGLKKLIESNPTDGKYEIRSDEIFASVMTYSTLPEDKKKFELHRKYIDIQYIVYGEEIIGGETLDLLSPTDGEGSDIEFFAMVNEYDKIHLKAGELAIILPPEPHAPGIAVNAPKEVKKIVVKVLM